MTAKHGGLYGGKPVEIYRVEMIAGPRAGALEIQVADLSAGRMLRGLQANNMADSRQLIPWQFPGDPAIFMNGHAIRMEAPWTDDLAEKDIPLHDLAINPHAGNPKNPLRWITGKNEMGVTVTMALSDSIPHVLIGGQTGSGKTVAMRSAIAQVARTGSQIRNGPRFVLIDAKFGAGFGPISRIPGMVGPMATDPESATNALAWALGQMKERLVRKSQMAPADWEQEPPILVAIDEIQEVTQIDANVALIRQLAALGREAKVHLMAGTQHPIIEAFGDSSIKRNLAAGVIALRTADAKSSEVVVGAAEPRADRLLGKGDSYVVAPGQVHRTQIAYMTNDELAAINTGRPLLDEWPEYEPEDAAGMLDGTMLYKPEEVALSLVNARYGDGRDKLKQKFVSAGLKMPGSPKANRLRDYGREVLSFLNRFGWDMVATQIPMTGDEDDVLTGKPPKGGALSRDLPEEQ